MAPLKKLILQSQKNSLSYSLQALEAYMSASSDYGFLGQSLMEKIVASIFDPLINVSKHALAITNLFTRPDSPSKGALIFMNKKKFSLDIQALANLLSDNTELELQIAALRFINNLLSHQSDQERDEGVFLQTLYNSEIPNHLSVRKSSYKN